MGGGGRGEEGVEAEEKGEGQEGEKEGLSIMLQARFQRFC